MKDVLCTNSNLQKHNILREHKILWPNWKESIKNEIFMNILFLKVTIFFNKNWVYFWLPAYIHS